jgi:hypothetical protein
MGSGAPRHSGGRGEGENEDEAEGVRFWGLRAWETKGKGVCPEQPWLRPWELVGSSA